MSFNLMGKLRSWFTEHWGLKIVSLLLAIGFWFYAQGEEMVQVTRTIPFHIGLEAKGRRLGISKRSHDSIYIRLEAPRGLLSVLSSGDISASHMITGVEKAGEYSFRVLPGDVKIPSSAVRVTSIYPETVTVMVDETITKKLPIEVNFMGEPAFGYKVLKDKVELDPNAVLADGPKEKLDAIESIKTEPIELVGRTRSFRKIARLEINPDVHVTSESVIDIFIPIREEYTEHDYADVQVKPLGLPADGLYVVLDTPVISFVLKGPKSELERLAANGVLAYVDVNRLKRGSYDLPATFILPDTVSLKMDPPAVKLRVEKAH